MRAETGRQSLTTGIYQSNLTGTVGIGRAGTVPARQNTTGVGCRTHVFSPSGRVRSTGCCMDHAGSSSLTEEWHVFVAREGTLTGW